MRIDYFLVSEKLKERIVACEMHGHGIELEGKFLLMKMVFLFSCLCKKCETHDMDLILLLIHHLAYFSVYETKPNCSLCYLVLTCKLHVITSMTLFLSLLCRFLWK